jgi:hypothetical protein
MEGIDAHQRRGLANSETRPYRLRCLYTGIARAILSHERGFCRRAAKTFGRAQLKVFEDAIEINTDSFALARMVDQFA